MKCPQCGHDNPEDALFCGGCGASLSASTPIGVGGASSEPPTGSFPKTIKTTHHRRIKPWMWIVSGVVGLLVILWIAFGLMFTGEWCPAFLGCEDWGQVSRGDSYAEEGLYERAIHEYDEAIRLERQEADAYYKRGLAHEALGKAKEASRDFEKAIQEYDEDIRRDPQPYAYYQRALAYEALGKTIEAARDFAEAKELGYDDDGSQSTGLLEAAPEASNFQIFLDDFTKTIEVAPLVLEGELSRDDTVTSWSFEGNEGQILQFELRPESGSHVDFGHVQIRLSLVDDERLQTADPEVIGKDEELEEIALPETGTYTLEVEGNIDETSGAYVITISGQ